MHKADDNLLLSYVYIQPVAALVSKVIQLYETMIVRHGVMLVGPTGGGKTTTYEILKDTLTNLHAEGIENQYYQPVQTFVLNPKVPTYLQLKQIVLHLYCRVYLWVSCMER